MARTTGCSCLGVVSRSPSSARPSATISNYVSGTAKTSSTRFWIDTTGYRRKPGHNSRSGEFGLSPPTTNSILPALDRPYWIEARFERREGWDDDAYPFNVPAVRTTEVLTFHPRVTFLVGENGSGKSTLIEALAMAWGFNAEGGSRDYHYSTRASHSALHRFVRPVRSPARA